MNKIYIYHTKNDNCAPEKTFFCGKGSAFYDNEKNYDKYVSKLDKMVETGKFSKSKKQLLSKMLKALNVYGDINLLCDCNEIECTCIALKDAILKMNENKADKKLKNINGDLYCE